MKLQTYEAIVSIIEGKIHERDCLKTLAQEFPKVTRDTLRSIYSQCYQSYTKAIHWSHKKPDKMKEYYKQYLSAMRHEISDLEKSEVILKMSYEIRFSPSLSARIILEQYIIEQNILPPNISSPNSLVSQWIKSPNKIPDDSLQLQVKHCILNDSNYGPLAENIKHSVGCEYEYLLKEKIDGLLIPYLDEKALRLRGYDKTPDFKLEVPVAVGDYIVNWIESKASFGDKQSHSRYLEDQFWSYQNRFGSGLVIYWFGFVEELNIHRKQGIVLMDHLPTNITTLLQTLE